MSKMSGNTQKEAYKQISITTETVRIEHENYLHNTMI